MDLVINEIGLRLAYRPLPSRWTRPQIEKMSDLEVAIISIGSTSRPEFQETQRETWGKVLPQSWAIHTYNEDSFLPECKICDYKEWQTKKKELVPLSVYVSKSEQVWTHKNTGWWCAQKRHTLAVADAFRKYKAQWYFIVDDDTFVHTKNLKNLISERDPSVQRYEGRVLCQKFLGGGAGHLISRGLANTLLQDNYIDRCIDMIQGKDWCFLHSDWALSECIHSLTGMLPQDNILFNQDNEMGCSNNIVATHPMNNSLQEVCARKLHFIQ
eukprot:CFRG4880T1